MNGFINMDENKTDEKDVITATKEAVTESDSTNNIAEVTDTENIENQEDEDEVKKEEENNKETEKDDIPSNKNKPNETENSDPKSQDKEFSTEKEDPVSNKFLQRFSSLSKSINTNPAVVRAGIVLQTAAAQGIIPTRVNQNASSSSDDEYTSDDSSVESSKEKESKSEAFDERKVRRKMAETAASAAAAISNTAVATASAAASSSVSSSFRGRYALFGSSSNTSNSQNQSSVISPNNNKGGSNNFTEIQSHTSPIASVTSPNNNSTSGSGIKSPGSGLFNAFAKRSNRILSNATKGSSPTPRPSGTRSQTSLILNSSAGTHMQKVLSQLKEGEYVMFLGPGFMGVNLKQSFQRHHGVYVDYIVPNGSADKSGVVSVGDSLLKVGHTDVTHGTIRNVPSIIAQADRPVIIVLQRDFKITGGPMDIAIGKVLQVQEEARGGTTGGKLLSHLPVSAEKAEETKNSEAEIPNEQETPKHSEKKESSEEEKKTNGDDVPSLSDSPAVNTPKTKSTIDGATLPENNPETPKSGSSNKSSTSVKTHSYHRQNSNRNHLPSPTKEVKDSLIAYANKRNNEMSSFAALSRATKEDKEFQDIIVAAFHSCCVDSRCLSFLASYFSGEDSYDYYSESNGVINNTSSDTNTLSPKSSNAPPTSSIRLMLYLEILSFEEMFEVTPAHRRRDNARRIAHKFLVPSLLPENSNPSTPNAPISESYSPPMFDLRSALPASFLHQVAKTISDESIPIAIDVFDKCKSEIRDSLCGNRFANFLISNECARMRAYLRGTNHYRHIPIEDLWSGLKESDVNASNYFLYVILHFVCWNDENSDAVAASQNERGKPIAGICAALFLQKELFKCIESGKEEKEELFAAYENFWEIFLCPHAGMLDSISHSNECQEALDYARAVVMKAAAQPYLVKALIDKEIVSSLTRLSEELLYDFAINLIPKFKQSAAHELFCHELQSHQKDIYDGIPNFPNGCIKRLVRKSHFPASVSSHKPQRGIDIKDKNKRHASSNKFGNNNSQKHDMDETKISRSLADQLDKEAEESENDTEINATKLENDVVLELDNPFLYNADFAIVFGTDDAATGIPSMGGQVEKNQTFIKRFATVPLGQLKDANIPSTLESYAVVPAFREKSGRFRTLSNRVSDDGWEASLINYIVPNPSQDNPNRCIFGVSLVLHQRDEQYASSKNVRSTKSIDAFLSASPTDSGEEKNKNNISTEEGMVVFDDTGSPLFARSPPSSPSPNALNRVGENIKRIIVSAVTPEFSRHLGENKWSQTSRRGGNTIGITLISSRNVIPAMRKSLSQFFESLTISADKGEVSSSPAYKEKGSGNGRFFAPLADVFGTMSLPSVNKDDLQRMLQPYIESGSSDWIDRPLSIQKDEYDTDAGNDLIHSLPPIPLALLFIAALLEQKIIFSSTRRSILLSACTALTNMLHPIEWSHLVVPLVPAALANDLIQYPAPYIIGVPSDDPQSVELLNSLPPEVTLVDLDVGRVILASSFASESNKVDATADLRSQMLSLAETLGDLFGKRLCTGSWLCDDPFSMKNSGFHRKEQSPYQLLRNDCHNFIVELLTGTSSCCYWIEEHLDETKLSEAKESSTTVLFDENRFLQLKNLREQGHYMPLFPMKHIEKISHMNMLGFVNHFALSTEDFDLILKSFLRTQGMSTYISSMSKKSMAFC